MPMRGNIPKKLLVGKWDVLQAGSNSQLSSNKIFLFLCWLLGLDAAGPLFTSSESNEIRLHHTDAEFVDAIHCEAGKVF